VSISFFETVISPRAIQLTAEVLRSGWVSEGFRVADFEEALSRDHHLSHPVALNSGTSALHLALVLSGVKAGDEVVLPPQTFVATGHAVLMQQATPVFADIDPATGNLSAASLERALSDRTKAVIAVHWGGYPCDLAGLGEVAARHQVVLIEDAAHALGAAFQGRAIGSVSRFTCFSFQAIKHVTCGDGGALCCTDAGEAAEARRRRWFGIDRGQAGPFELGEREGAIEVAGFKYHMNDLAAAVGLGNLAGFRERLARRREIAAVYRQGLEGVPGLTLLRSDPGHESAHWLFTMLVERRASFVRALEDRGVPTSVVHRRIDRHPVFGGTRPELAGQDSFDQHQISIPLHSTLSDREVQQIVEGVRTGW
jgi:perosamine synthetase